MRYFKLPDLGEGLPEAEILEWHVKAGDEVQEDQPLVSVETAKAVIQVPSPQTGIIAHLFGEEGDTIHTGEPLVEFQTDDSDDTGTVVGNLSQAGNEAETDSFIIGASPSSRIHSNERATPAVRALAKRLNIDLSTVKGTGNRGHITTDDIERAIESNSEHGAPERLRGVRKHMALNMARAHQQIVPVSLFEDVNISSWPRGTDITMRLVEAISAACQQVPILNSAFDSELMTFQQHEKIDLGVAVDTDQGLFVPVLRDISNRDRESLRNGLNNLREAVASRKIPPEELQGATITLSNFGTMAGKYATPIIVPPQVAIVGAGVIREAPVVSEGELKVGRILPLSLTFDHQIATGGEAARFLATCIEHLES